MSDWPSYLVIAVASFIIGCYMRYFRKKAKMYRQLWIELGATWEGRLEKMRAERNEHFTTAQWQAVALGEYKTRVALQKQELTKLYAGRDSLLNGDRCCVVGHRYHTGEGVTCPHCGAAERKLSVAMCFEVTDWTQAVSRLERRIQQLQESSQ